MLKFITYFLLFIYSENLNPYKSYKFYGGEITLPNHYKFKILEHSLDWCYASGTSSDESVEIYIDIIINTRFETNNIKELYELATKVQDLHITYHTQKNNWLVVSGFSKADDKIVYWKRIAGKRFIGDVRIRYSKDKKHNIEPYLSTISKSFTVW